MYLTSENLFDLASTIAVLALLAAVYGSALRRIGMAPLRNAALGLLFGLAAAGAMLQPIMLEAGVLFDLRALPLGLAGAFLGPFGALPAMGVAGVMRIAIGGSGMIAGLVAIGIAGFAGSAWFFLARFLRPLPAFRLLVLSLMISLHLLAVLLLPGQLAAKILVELAPLTILLNLFGTLVVGGMFNRERCAVERERALEKEVLKDPLTGIANRRGFARLVEGVSQRGSATGSALLIIDLDHFKAINDTHGHAAGDLVLMQLGARLQACLRGSDIVARFGGEEFVAFLPATPVDAAMLVAERLRCAVVDEPFAVGGCAIRVTISVGAHWEAGLVECSAAFASADRALYSAKAKGRNRVVFDHWMGAGALAA
jgi:diguanylate cyclase